MKLDLFAGRNLELLNRADDLLYRVLQWMEKVLDYCAVKGTVFTVL